LRIEVPRAVYQTPNLVDENRLSPRNLVAALAKEYASQCEILCYGTHPAFPDVLGRLEAVRDRLKIDLYEAAISE